MPKENREQGELIVACHFFCGHAKSRLANRVPSTSVRRHKRAKCRQLRQAFRIVHAILFGQPALAVALTCQGGHRLRRERLLRVTSDLEDRARTSWRPCCQQNGNTTRRHMDGHRQRRARARQRSFSRSVGGPWGLPPTHPRSRNGAYAQRDRIARRKSPGKPVRVYPDTNFGAPQRWPRWPVRRRWDDDLLRCDDDCDGLPGPSTSKPGYHARARHRGAQLYGAGWTPQHPVVLARQNRLFNPQTY